MRNLTVLRAWGLKLYNGGVGSSRLEMFYKGSKTRNNIYRNDLSDVIDSFFQLPPLHFIGLTD